MTYRKPARTRMAVVLGNTTTNTDVDNAISKGWAEGFHTDDPTPAWFAAVGARKSFVTVSTAQHVTDLANAQNLVGVDALDADKALLTGILAYPTFVKDAAAPTGGEKGWSAEWYNHGGVRPELNHMADQMMLASHQYADVFVLDGWHDDDGLDWLAKQGDDKDAGHWTHMLDAVTQFRQNGATASDNYPFWQTGKITSPTIGGGSGAGTTTPFDAEIKTLFDMNAWIRLDASRRFAIYGQAFGTPY